LSIVVFIPESKIENLPSLVNTLVMVSISTY